MITFIFIVGVLMRAIPMIGVLLLIWHVSRKPTGTELRAAGEADYAWRPASRFGEETKTRSARRRAVASAGRPGRRARVFTPLATPANAD